MSSADETPTGVPLGRREYQVIVDKLNGISSVCASITVNQIEMLIEVRALAEADRKLDRRVTALEVSRQWVPFVLSAIAIAASAYNMVAIHALGR